MSASPRPSDRSHEQAGKLPVELTSFIGRRQELSDVKRLLSAYRLVTLTGPGGVGKTRLATQVSMMLRRAFPDGVWFIDLAGIHPDDLRGRKAQGPDPLAYLVANGLDLQWSTSTPLAALTEHLSTRRLLLLLDNCEHVLPACVVLVDFLLRACPQQRVLTTSRQPLQIGGEVTFTVPPLAVSDVDPTPTHDFQRCEAVALFASRAAAVAPDFRIDQGNQSAVTEICRRLDGLPLAIELAAARIRVLSPRQILDRMADRFRLLNRGNRSAPLRQQTLRATMDWSFELCTTLERVLWRRLSVFMGGFELADVEGVCADEQLPRADLIDLVGALVEKSILVRGDHGDQARYRMLETIRDFGLEKLRESDEERWLRRRHRDWYERLVAQARAEWVSDRQEYWLDRLGHEQPNLRTAIEFCLAEPGEAEGALRLLVHVPPLYWRLRGLLGEGRHWLSRALADTALADTALADTAAPSTLRTRALLLCGYLATWQDDVDAELRLLDEGQAAAERSGATLDLAYAACVRGFSQMFRNKLPAAVESLERGLTLLSAAPEPDLDLHLHLLVQLALAAGLAGDDDRAAACQQQIVAISEPRGESIYRSRALLVCSMVAWHRGHADQAAAQALASVRLIESHEANHLSAIALCLELLAWVAAAKQRYDRAAVLLGAADARWSDLGTPITSFPLLIGYHRDCERQTRLALGAAFADAQEHGRVLPLLEAHAYALEERRPAAPSTTRTTAAAPLTPRERQVADLVARGLSNRDIAETLVISKRTAESHVEHILAKLGFASRTQVAAWAIGQHADNQP